MSNLNFNQIILCGRLTADPELKHTQNGNKVVSFGLAVNRKVVTVVDGKKQYDTDFINCVAWRNTAEFVGNYFKKGSPVLVVGSLQTRSWTDNQNFKRFTTEVVVDEVRFVDSVGDNKPAAPIPPEYVEVKGDEPLPF